MLDVGQFLACEHHRHIAFAQRLQPILNLVCEEGVLQKEPRLIQHQHGRTPVKPTFERMEERAEDGPGRLLLAQQFVHLECLHGAMRERRGVVIDKTPERTGLREGLQGGARTCVLHQRGDERQCAILARALGKEFDHPPEFGAKFWRHADIGRRDESRQPIERPRSIFDGLQTLQRLQAERALFTQIEEIALETEDGRASGAALVEEIKLRAGIAHPLCRQRREQYGFAAAGRADNHGVTDIADMQIESKRRRAIGRRQHERRPLQMRVALRACPDRAQRQEMRKAWTQKHRTACVGIGLTGQRPEPCLHRVDALHLGHETEAVRNLLDLADRFIRRLFIPIGDNNGERCKSGAHRIGAQFLQRVVGVFGLVGGVIVHEQRFFTEERFAQQREETLAFRKPALADALHFAAGVLAIERNETAHPAIGERQAIERIEKTRLGLGDEASHRDNFEVLFAELG